MLRTLFLLTLVALLLTVPAPGASQAHAGSNALAETSFAPGQVLVRLAPDASPAETVNRLAGNQTPKMVRRIADHTFTLSVPVGREESALKTLAADPAVENVSLNYLITETPPEPAKLLSAEAAGEEEPAFHQEIESCITDLWMSTTQRSEPLLENMVPSGTPQAYIFFEYTDCDLEAVRAEVFYLSPDAAPEEVFDEAGLIISGSGIQGIRVPAWTYFPEGTFPVGRYLTILSLSPEGGWDEVENESWRVSTFPDDYWFQGSTNYQWNLHSTGRRAPVEADINMPQAWDTTTGGDGLAIAFISTGVKIDHPDLQGKIWTNRQEIPDNGIDDDENGCVDDVHGCEFYDGEATPDPMDMVNWGTFTSGVAAAATNNEVGVAGISWGARIMPIKVLRLLPGGVLGGFLADLVTAIDYAVDNGARIIHIGPRIEDENVTTEQLALLRDVIEDAVAQGALVVAGTGDLASTQLLYPAAFDSVVAVGATDQRNERAWFSNGGPGIDLVAPGELILSTCVTGPYCIGSGTSLAAAHVDGVAALIWSLNPDLTPAEVRDILHESAVDVGAPGYDEDTGYGKVDAADALELTPHHLNLHTANLDDPHALRFLLDDQTERACQYVWNPWTAPYTWTLDAGDDEWLTTERINGSIVDPVPSKFQVCVDRAALAGPGTYQATIEARSTLTRHNGPMEIDVTAIYQQSRLSRLFLSFIQRP